MLTRPDHPSGSDRIFEALGPARPGRAATTWWSTCRAIFRPSRPSAIAAALGPLADPDVAIAHACRRDRARGGADQSERREGGRLAGRAERRLRALYFTRATAPWGEGPLYHHSGIYAYRRAALERFVALPPSALEKRERLEQLRALEAGMRIDVTVIDEVPFGVDTPEDLERARRAARRKR